MSLIYITGISGSGKSTVAQELKKRGFKSYDAENAHCFWFDRKTHKMMKNFSKYGAHSATFHKKYEWLLIHSRVEELAKRAIDKKIFLCGAAANESAMVDLFSKVIELVIDENTLRHRITNRTTNQFGKSPHEWEMVLGWYKSLKPRFISVDATQPLDKVVDEILKIASS